MSISRVIQAIGSLFLPVFIALFFFVFLPCWQLNAEMVDKVVAVVNDEVITLSELDKEGESTFRKVATTTPSEDLQRALTTARAEVLETLIDKKIIAQKAAAQNITVSDAEVDAALANVMKRTRMTREQLLAKLEEAGVDEAVYKNTLRSQILQNKLVGADVTSKIIVTEEMILDYYDTHYVSKSNVDGYYLLQIGCTWLTAETKNNPQAATNAEKLDARKRIEKVHQLASSGQNFSELARKYSQLPSRTDGGDIGTFELDDMAADMRSAVSSLKPGGISKIIEMSSGYQFFKLLSSGDGNYTQKESYEAVKESIKQELYEEQVQKAYADWVKKLKDQAYIQKL